MTHNKNYILIQTNEIKFMVERAGFEPANALHGQIYSLLLLATQQSLHKDFGIMYLNL